MYNGVKKETGGIVRPLVSISIVLFVAAVLIYAAVQNRTQQNNVTQESAPMDGASTDALANVALPELEPEKPEVDSSSMEIINDVLLSNVPKADYSYSFNGKLNDSVVVTRAGDEGRFNSGTYPEMSEDVFPLFTEGVEGDALYLDGSYGVALQGVEPLNESYTISFWFRADELNQKEIV